VFDPGANLCHRGHVRRLIAALLVSALVAAMAAPAIAACPRQREKPCCCAPPRSNALCAPDCCGIAKAAQPIVQVTAHRHPLSIGAPAFVCAAGHVDLASIAPAPPPAQWLVGLHARAAPRLPLRI
jgi:hypothetical protein